MLKALPRFFFFSTLAGFLSALLCSASQSQGLPNTNYGKFVHQPGDNQYENSAQKERHAPAQQQVIVTPGGGGTAVGGGGGGQRGGYAITPPPPSPDISILPIVTDEPVKPAGFPPLPDRFDLPVTTAWARASSDGGAAAGGASASTTGGRQYDSHVQGVHEHYVHYQAGAFMPAQPAQQQASQQPRSAGYYKCTTPNSDYYNVNSRPGQVQEREPRLNSKLDGVQQPGAPTPVIVNQSTTQDLSLSDDEFAAKPTTTRNSWGKQVVNGIGRTMTNTVTSGVSTGASMGYSMLRYR